MLMITRFGNPSTVVFVIIVSLVIIWYYNRQEAKIFALACLGAFILNTGLKLTFNKPSPHLWQQLISEKSFSFPSGHALGSLVLYGFLAYLLATYYPRYAKVFYILAVVAIAAIGLSRLYLGVYWPTDIIAGYGVGFLWLMLCIIRNPKKNEAAAVLASNKYAGNLRWALDLVLRFPDSNRYPPPPHPSPPERWGGLEGWLFHFFKETLLQC